VRFLGSVRGVWLHWEAGRTWPCIVGTCTRCEAGVPARWCGYAPALLFRQDAASRKIEWVPVVVDLAEVVGQELLDKELRGVVAELSRPGRRRNGPMACVVHERTLEDPLPPTFAVEDVLYRMWGVRLPAPPVDGAADDEASPRVIPFRRPRPA
jgi:hypothetical protein